MTTPPEAPHAFPALRDAVHDDRGEPARRLTNEERERLKKELVARFASARPSEEAKGAIVRSFRHRVAAFSSVGGAVAIAASVVLLLRQGGPDLGNYEVSVGGAPAASRASASSSRIIEASGPDVRVEIVLRPERAVSEPLSAFAFVQRDGDWRRAPGSLEVSSSGSVRFVSTSEPFRGASELKIVVGTTQRLSEAEAIRAARGSVGPKLKVFPIVIR